MWYAVDKLCKLKEVNFLFIQGVTLVTVMTLGKDNHAVIPLRENFFHLFDVNGLYFSYHQT